MWNGDGVGGREKKRGGGGNWGGGGRFSSPAQIIVMFVCDHKTSHVLQPNSSLAQTLRMPSWKTANQQNSTTPTKSIPRWNLQHLARSEVNRDGWKRIPLAGCAN